MKIYHNINDFRGTSYAVITVGTFDGLHIGHQKIIARMKEIAAINRGATLLVTFDPHPRQVLEAGKSDIKFISTQRRKIQLLDQFGIDHMVVIPFTLEFSRTPSDVFIKEYLIKLFRVKTLVVGYDHHFGRNREGNYDRLKQLGAEYGFSVEEIEAQYVDGIPVSSTKIRNALMEGDVSLAARMLGYSYSISGVVIPGNALGRKIGFPTANIEVEDRFKLIAAGGVYACRIEVEGQLFEGMGNIGTRPTIGINGLVTEVHLFDFNGDLYGKKITIFFIDRIRNEIKFASMEELGEQLKKDQDVAKALLRKNKS